jgi:SAM-dependent methyltransferase
MPIQIGGTDTKAIADRFAEATDLIASEFKSLNRHEQYRSAFARLTKWDPLCRVHMMGTDQRDLFVPLVRRLAGEIVQPAGVLLDIGCGDGQTFGLIADAIAPGTTVSYADPNPEYVSSYGRAVDGSGLVRGAALVAGFDEVDDASKCSGTCLPPEGSVDLVLALHMIYFLPDLEASLRRMYRFLRPGGAMVIIVADESVAYTGMALEACAERLGSRCDGLVSRQRAAIDERRRLFGGNLIPLLANAVPGSEPALEIVSQPTRLYGHTISDIVALANIAMLMEFDDLAKFEAVSDFLQRTPERVDLRIEDAGPRLGMLSVAQPQTIVIVRRTS